MTPRRARVFALIAVIAGTALVSVLGFFYFRDNFSTHYPVKVLSAKVYRSGEIPYWNFHDGGGQPLAGNPNTLTFYPDNFLYLILPAHVAFNLHFLLHLIAAWFAMRALSRSPWAAWMYVLSGAAISATAFYNLIVAVAVIPFAFWAASRRNLYLLGAAFGLLALAGDPMTILAAAIGVAILWPSWRLLPAAAISFLIALPQLIAYSEIAGEVERAHGYSAATVLNASLSPKRILEMIVGPWFRLDEPHLFLSLFIGIIVIPALLQRSRYVAIALVSLFFALGRFNPVVEAIVDATPRVARFPEKFAIVFTVAIAVLAARVLVRREWQVITLVPLALSAILTIPIDWFAPYDVSGAPAPSPAKGAAGGGGAPRVFVPVSPGGQEPSRADYRARARRLEPMFGAVAGLRYACDRSPDGMFSLASRIAAERVQFTRNAKWLRIAGCENVPRALPHAMIVPSVVSANDPVRAIEAASFDEHATAIGPARFNEFRSPAEAKIVSATDTDIRVTTPAPAILLVNETYFRAWDSGGYETFPLDLDRLGILVPAGDHTIHLRFGRHHTAVAVTWALSLLVLAVMAAALRVEVLDRRAGEVERSADEDVLAARA